jgi:fucose 4-O-acetylase-like acetyltransferase
MIIFDMPDFWWSSPVCYAVGSLCAENKEMIKQHVTKKNALIILGFSIVLYGLACKWSLILILPTSLVCSLAIVPVTAIIRPRNILFQKIGSASLTIYLGQLCMMNLILNSLPIMNGEIKVILYASLSILIGMAIDKLVTLRR